MKAKKTFLTFLAASAVSLGAQTEATSTTDASTLEALRESPWGFNLISDVQTGLRDDETNVGNVNFFYLNYALTEKDTLELETRIYHSNNFFGHTGTDWDRVVARYRRGILNQEDHGINLSGIVEHRSYVTGRVKNLIRRNLNGLAGVGISFNRVTGGSFSMPNAIMFYQNYLADSSIGSTQDNHWYYFGLPTYNFTDTWSVGVMIEGYHSNLVDGGNSTSLEVAPEVGYSFSPDVRLALYLEMYPMKSGDGSLITDTWESEDIKLGSYLTATLF